jgi:sugar fermentation stimulation protein A
VRSGANPAHARFVARDNRFVVRAELAGGEVVPAYLPNTARLHDLLMPGTALRLAPAEDPGRRTAWTVTRAWDGTWVALAADAASGLVADHLVAGGRLPGWPAITAVRREVVHGRHRLDLEVTFDDGRRGLVEVKSLSRARDRIAPLSVTPSARGVAHLAALAKVARAGTPAAVVFVVQRDDADVLDLTAAADPAWQAAVGAAQAAGVHVVGFACEVDERRVRLGRELEVRATGSALSEVVAHGRPARSLAATYAGSVVHLRTADAGPVTIEPVPGGGGPGRLPALLPPATRRLVVLTACNPRSRLLGAAENADRNRRLLAELEARSLRWIIADGSSPDGSWHEPGYGVVDGDVDEVLALARRFEQLAVFELTATRLRVRWTEPGPEPIEQGWRIASP